MCPTGRTLTIDAERMNAIRSQLGAPPIGLAGPHPGGPLMHPLPDTEAMLGRIAAELIDGKTPDRAVMESWRQWRDDDGRDRLDVTLRFIRRNGETDRPARATFGFVASEATPSSWLPTATTAEW